VGLRDNNEISSRYKKNLNYRRVHACGVYNTFKSNTSKYSLEALRPIRVRVSRERLHAWHVNN